MSVKRYDSAQLQKPQYLSNGWVRVDAFIARTGVLEYPRADGSTWLEYRPPDEHNAAALESFDAVPFTNSHPGVMLDSENTKLYQVGTVLSPRADGEKVRASILVTDAKTVAAIKSGKVELSCGYTCDVDNTPGVTADGKRYDAIQTNVRGNHVALVTEGRAGPEVRLRLDGVDPDLTPVEIQVPCESMMKIRIDAVEYEVSETVAQAVAKLDSQIAELQKSNESQKAHLDAATGKVSDLEKAVADAPTKVRAELQARASLEKTATDVLGAESKFDGKSDSEVKRMVAETSGLKCDGKSDAYVDAAFEIAIQKHAEVKAIAKSTEGTTPARSTETPKADGSGASLAEATRKRNLFLENLHRNKPSES